MATQKPFAFRAFISLTTAITFLIVAATGIVLFFTPPGRIANATGWTFAALPKPQWIALHISTCVVFTLAALLHTLYNLRPLLYYCKNRVTKRFAFRLEWIAALALTVLIVAGTLTDIPPFRTLSNLSQHLKHMRNETNNESQYPDKPQSKIRRQGQQSELESHTSEPPHPAGLGRMTIEQLCTQQNIEIETALQRLKEQGIDAFKEDPLKDLAATYNKMPPDLYKIITTPSNE